MGVAVKFLIVLVALLQIAESVPAPDPDPDRIEIQAVQKVNYGCGIGGCPEDHHENHHEDQKECCIFGPKAYHHNDIINKECLKMKCNNGIWDYISFDPGCGNCSVIGDPHIYTFDPSNGPVIGAKPVPKYRLQGDGEYVITQHGLKNPDFGVTGNFDVCRGADSCIKDITYYEPGISITMVPPPTTTVVVRKIPKLLYSSQIFFGDGGAIVVFRHSHVNHISQNLNCISILGTKGYSVTLCQRMNSWPYLYIRALPTLTFTLYGLCNSYTGTGSTATIFMGGPKEPGAYTNQASKLCLTMYSDPQPGPPLYDICAAFSNTWIV